ncbi:MAG TPA: peptide deformylase [Rhodospirillaceae bacterium]|nr:peptide deformylase [Rhodospirillaceae bacterium]
MTKLIVRTVPDPVLREKAKPVAAIDARIQKLMKDMMETMYADDGIGLAANQIGVLERVIVVDVSETRDGSEALLMANPEILWASEETFTYREGCLSVRPCSTETTADLYANVTRPRAIRVRYLDINGATQEIEAQELFSQCIQHEIDHLDGILFVDHISTLKRGMIMRKIEKLRRVMPDEKPL